MRPPSRRSTRRATTQTRPTPLQVASSSTILRGSRPAINQMTHNELRAWIGSTRAALQKKMARERAYLDRRALRGIHTPTDEAYETDQLLEADLLDMLTEFERHVALIEP
jgi:hypothetical protein